MDTMQRRKGCTEEHKQEARINEEVDKGGCLKNNAYFIIYSAKNKLEKILQSRRIKIQGVKIRIFHSFTTLCLQKERENSH